MKRLEVRPSEPRALRATEKSFEKEVVDAIHAVRGAAPLKADGIRGWPDRYVGRGHWIEFKSAVFGKWFWPYNQVDLDQKTAARTFAALGDKPYICILWLDADTGREYVQFTPWDDFQADRVRWTKGDYRQRPDIWPRDEFIPYVMEWARAVGKN